MCIRDRNNDGLIARQGITLLTRVDDGLIARKGITTDGLIARQGITLSLIHISSLRVKNEDRIKISTYCMIGKVACFININERSVILYITHIQKGALAPRSVPFLLKSLLVLSGFIPSINCL